MNVIFVAIFVVFVAVSAEETYRNEKDVEFFATPRSFESKIAKTLECARKKIKNGDENIKMPKMDPFNDKFYLDLTPFVIVRGFVNASKIIFSGLSAFEYPELVGKVNLIPPMFGLEFKMTLPQLLLDVEYDMNVTYNKQNYFGNGNINFLVKDIVVEGNIHANLFPMSIDKLMVKVDLNESKLKLTGLNDDEELSQKISDYVTEKLPTLIKTFSPIITDIIKESRHKINECFETKEGPVDKACQMLGYFMKECSPF